MSARILVTGSRGWYHPSLYFHLGRAVEEFGPDVVVVHGGCPNGADVMADGVCRQYGIPVEPHPADWNGPYGRAAGFSRNAEMVALGADVCLAFIAACTKPGCAEPTPHGSHGATHCADLAEKAGIPVRRWTR